MNIINQKFIHKHGKIQIIFVVLFGYSINLHLYIFLHLKNKGKWFETLFSLEKIPLCLGLSWSIFDVSSRRLMINQVELMILGGKSYC